MNNIDFAENDLIVLLPVLDLAKYCNPFKHTPWGVDVSIKDIKHAIETSRLVEEPFSISKIPYNEYDHNGRIAYLVVNPSDHPIDIDVGVPSLRFSPHWIINDGNHRFSAALYRYDQYIKASISGCIEYAEYLFGIKLSTL